MTDLLRGHMIWSHLHYLSASHQLVYWRNPLANNYLLGRIFAQLDLDTAEVINAQFADGGKVEIPAYVRTWQFCIYRPSLNYTHHGSLTSGYSWKPVDYIPLRFWRITEPPAFYNCGPLPPMPKGYK